eukprot:UN13691
MKIILQKCDFQNHPSMEKTLKNVILQLINKSKYSKKHTQFSFTF